jgi:hypothetical protein
MLAGGKRTQRLGLLALATTVLATVVLAVSAVSALASNANFLGTWNPTTGQPWTVTSQEPDGACEGTSSLSGFTFTGCHVSGDSYEFTVEEPGYSSYNHGTIEGDSLTGEFDDTFGHEVPYTAVREATPVASITGEPSVALPESGTETETFTVSLSEAGSEPIEVDYETEDGTATVADDDYSEESGVLDFEPGQTSKQVTVTIDDGDGKDSGALEYYKVSLLDDSKGAVIPAAASATGTIGLPGFSGHTYDGKGHPLGGVKLTLSGRPRNGSPVTQEVTTEANGAYTIAVDPGEYSIYAHGVPSGQPPGLKWTPGAACPGVVSGAYCEKIYLHSSDGKPASAKVDFAYGDPDPEAENLEVLQAVQKTTFDAAGPQMTFPDGTKAASFAYTGVGLGAGSPTIVRLYGANNGAVTAESVNAQLRGFANGVELPGGPIPALDNGLNLIEAPQFEPDRAKAESTFNFTIPEAWTTTGGPITLLGTVDPAKTFPECAKCRENDSVALTGVTFTKEKPLTFKPVPLTWEDKGATIAPLNASATIEAVWPWFPLARSQIVVEAATAPVNLTATLESVVLTLRKTKKPLPTDPHSLWDCLADSPCNDVLTTPLFMLEMEAAGDKFKAAATGGIPVGIFHGASYAGTLGETISLEPFPLFATDEAAGNRESLPHEILHALGFSHTAGCGSPTNPEPYPVTPPNILGFGVNRSSSLHGGIGSILSGTASEPYTDLMSYCRPRWQSSVNWNRLVERLATGTLPPPVTTLASTSSLHHRTAPARAHHSAGAAKVTVQAVVIGGTPVFDGVLPSSAFSGGRGSAYSLQSTNAKGHVTHTTKMIAMQVEGDSTTPEPPVEVLAAQVPASEAGQLRIEHAGKTVARMSLPARVGLRLLGSRRACRRGGYVTLRYRTSAPVLLARARLSAGRGHHLKLVTVAGASGSIRIAAARLPKSDNRLSLSITDGFSSSSVTVPLRSHC